MVFFEILSLLYNFMIHVYLFIKLYCLFQMIVLLEEEDDINQITDYFSYEHFYVIYCKFWELDKDHDLFIDKDDLARHNDHGNIYLGGGSGFNELIRYWHVKIIPIMQFCTAVTRILSIY